MAVQISDGSQTQEQMVISDFFKDQIEPYIEDAIIAYRDRLMLDKMQMTIFENWKHLLEPNQLLSHNDEDKLYHFLLSLWSDEKDTSDKDIAIHYDTTTPIDPNSNLHRYVDRVLMERRKSQYESVPEEGDHQKCKYHIGKVTLIASNGVELYIHMFYKYTVLKDLIRCVRIKAPMRLTFTDVPA